jgi:2-keto-4-pentenoate hydratase
LRRDGEIVHEGRSDPDTLDDPYLSLARVCAALHPFGLGLEPGQRIITGSVLPGVKLEAGGHFEGDFGALGKVTAEFG